MYGSNNCFMQDSVYVHEEEDQVALQHIKHYLYIACTDFQVGTFMACAHYLIEK